jgi:hypothetical protein
MINLNIEPNQSPILWKDFKKKYPEFSMAIDGYVSDQSDYDSKRHIANFNHHEDCNRLFTMSTCAQVLKAMRMGLLNNFRDEKNEIIINLYANDCDEDICLTYFLIKNSYMVESTISPILNKLVSVEDMLDSTSGAYPFPKDSPILREMAWIFDPYYRARYNGLLNSKSSDIYKGIIIDVENRIMAYATGNKQQLPLETKYEIIGGGKGWKLVEEQGIHCRTAMRSDGISSFISVKKRDDSTYNYVIGKTSPFIETFDINIIYKELNKIENCTNDKWGGSDIIGGSPRVNGSKIKPEEIEKIINSII